MPMQPLAVDDQVNGGYWVGLSVVPCHPQSTLLGTPASAALPTTVEMMPDPVCGEVPVV